MIIKTKIIKYSIVQKNPCRDFVFLSIVNKIKLFSVFVLIEIAVLQSDIAVKTRKNFAKI